MPPKRKIEEVIEWIETCEDEKGIAEGEEHNKNKMTQVKHKKLIRGIKSQVMETGFAVRKEWIELEGLQIITPRAYVHLVTWDKYNLAQENIICKHFAEDQPDWVTSLGLDLEEEFAPLNIYDIEDWSTSNTWERGEYDQASWCDTAEVNLNLYYKPRALPVGEEHSVFIEKRKLLSIAENRRCLL